MEGYGEVQVNEAFIEPGVLKMGDRISIDLLAGVLYRNMLL